MRAIRASSMLPGDHTARSDGRSRTIAQPDSREAARSIDYAMHIHILGICGTFMGGIAAIARAAGHRVTGCDANVYPPMSDAARARSASS